MELDNLWEDEIKNNILQNKALFKPLGDLGNTLVIYEKRIYNDVIADCVIFSSTQGMIGVEIKTQHDSLKRLEKQLDSYVRTCAYTYVYCHDSKVNKVLELLKEKDYGCVGVISYEEFDNKALPGIIKSATYSPYITPTGYTSILWKTELKRLVESATKTKQFGSKRSLMKQLSALTSVNAVERIISSLYINGETDQDKPLQRYNFGDTYTHDITYRGDYHR